MLCSQQSSDGQQAAPCLCVLCLTKSSFINSSVDRLTWSPVFLPIALSPDLSNGAYNQRSKFGFQPFSKDSCLGLTFLQLLHSKMSFLFSLQSEKDVFFSHLRKGKIRPFYHQRAPSSSQGWSSRGWIGVQCSLFFCEGMHLCLC